MSGLLAGAAAFCIAVISGGGYLGIVGLMALESAATPLPSEIIMPFAGYLVTTGRFDLWLVATAGAIGCNVGSTIAYAFGAYGGRPMAERYGRYVFVGRGELDRMDRFFARYGNLSIFVARLLPGVRTFISLPAGIARMPMLPFQAYTFLGSWPWCFALAYVGLKLGERWDSDPALQAFMHRFQTVVVMAILGCIAAAAVWKFRGRSRQPP